MTTKTYRNKRNECKFIVVKRTNDRHYMWRQYMKWGDIINPLGVGLRCKVGFRRCRKGYIMSVLEDYEEVLV